MKMKWMYAIRGRGIFVAVDAVYMFNIVMYNMNVTCIIIATSNWWFHSQTAAEQLLLLFLPLLLFTCVCRCQHVYRVCVCCSYLCVWSASLRECLWLRARPALLYAGAQRRRIRDRETNLLRSEPRDNRTTASSERDSQRGGGSHRDQWEPRIGGGVDSGILYMMIESTTNR